MSFDNDNNLLKTFSSENPKLMTIHGLRKRNYQNLVFTALNTYSILASTLGIIISAFITLLHRFRPNLEPIRTVCHSVEL